MLLVKKILDLIFYSNLYIAICAVCMTCLTQLLIGEPFGFNALTGLIFCATLVIYALHRLFGLKKMENFLDKERFRVINQYKKHIWVYAILGLLGGLVCFFYVSNSVRWALIIPAILSLAYVLPVLGRNEKFRLRDISLVKIFFVAIVWAYVTTLLPILEAEIPVSNRQLCLMFIERACFVFAITLPFDIRDLEFDKHHKVKTIPAQIGLSKTLSLAMLLLMVFMLINGILYQGNSFILSGLFLSAISTYIFIHSVADKKHDYYFTGLIDGTMIIQFLFVYFLI